MSETRTGDIVDLLSQDHEEAKRLLGKITAAPGAREDLFWELVPELVRHEVAEEVVVYPTIRSDAPDGDAEVRPRLKEQQQAEEMLSSMEKLDPPATSSPSCSASSTMTSSSMPGGGAKHLPAPAGARARGHPRRARDTVREGQGQRADAPHPTPRTRLPATQFWVPSPRSRTRSRDAAKGSDDQRDKRKEQSDAE